MRKTTRRGSGIRWVIGAAVVLTLALVCAAGGMTAWAQSGQRASNIAQSCNLYASSLSGGYRLMRNGTLDDCSVIDGRGEQYLTVELAGNQAQGVYVKWGRYPPVWTLEATLADGQQVCSEQGMNGYIQEYFALPEGTVSFRMITADGQSAPMRIAELEVYSPGELPNSVHIWEPTPTTAELMAISTHPDDEILYFGGALPYYAGELKYDTVVVFVTNENTLRLHEALEGLWECGARQNPINLYYRDFYCVSLEGAEQAWKGSELVKELCSLIARYRPQVILAQDVNGEYGHGQHILTVSCVQQSVTKAADAQYMGANLPALTPWQVSKCYLHLYDRNTIVMQWGNITLPGLGGRTALRVAQDAFEWHVSQNKPSYGYSVSTTAEGYDCRRFGLYYTAVGADSAKDDFFENVVLRYRSVEPVETALPGYLERAGTRGWLYRRTDGLTDTSEYMRYCEVNGVIGWYAADATGALTEPTSTQLLYKDVPLDLAGYETLTPLGSDPPLYSYYDGLALNALVVRYGQIENNPPQFYLTDGSGTLDGGFTTITVSREVFRAEEIIITELPETQTGGCEGSWLTDAPSEKGVIILVSSMLAGTALVLSLTVWRLRRRRTREGRRRH